MKDETARIRRNRQILAIVLASVVALTTVQVTIQQPKFPTPIASNILIFALVNINIVLLLLLVLLVFRSLFKVYLERRENVLGSKIRVKLAVAFVGLALLPAGLRSSWPATSSRPAWIPGSISRWNARCRAPSTWPRPITGPARKIRWDRRAKSRRGSPRPGSQTEVLPAPGGSPRRKLASTVWTACSSSAPTIAALLRRWVGEAERFGKV